MILKAVLRHSQSGSARSLSAEMPEGNGTGFVWDDQVIHPCKGLCNTPTALHEEIDSEIKRSVLAWT